MPDITAAASPMAQVRMDALLPDPHALPGEISYVIDFGAPDPGEGATLFRQCRLDGAPEHSTGLLLRPDETDLVLAGSPPQWRRDPEHLRFYTELETIAQRWAQQNEDAGGDDDGRAWRAARERELRDLFDHWNTDRAGRVVQH
ncbi:hypothetical protein [Streptomyces sp. H27-D2]|uniref:hypothetical protein n=1 Tax=Streptomyces sp. H27-D2 TaxID=3046304 RepID=UPI002DBADAA7|nr:hypothetical protein [Streptomyces sp. H27-D2]MEC4020312.1 hypothetical protein [Streptomyces sp. H27-D2]